MKTYFLLGTVSKPASSSGSIAKQHSSSNQKVQSFVPINNKPPSKSQKMVALYDYDPQYLSPNADVDVICSIDFECFKIF